MKRTLCYSICLRCFTERLQKMFQKEISKDIDSSSSWTKSYADDLLTAHKRTIESWYANIYALYWQHHKEHPCFFPKDNIAYFQYAALNISLQLGGIKEIPDLCPYLLEHTVHEN